MGATLRKQTNTAWPEAEAVEWHVSPGDGRWQIVSHYSGHPPVTMYVTRHRRAPVQYRHRASNCHGSCPLGQ